MDNTLQKYLGRELKDSIGSLQVIQGISKQTNQPYHAIEITFINGYSNRLFLRNEEVFAWVNAFAMLDDNSAEIPVRVEA